jgi:hypothetical protein
MYYVKLKGASFCVGIVLRVHWLLPIDWPTGHERIPASSFPYNVYTLVLVQRRNREEWLFNSFFLACYILQQHSAYRLNVE